MINKVVFYILLIACATLFFSAQAAFAQTRDQLGEDEETMPTGQQTKRPNLLQELDLSPAQIRQIRQLNLANKAQRQAAKRRLEAANQALNDAIYADREMSDAEVQARVREVHDARLEVLKNRVQSEQNVRRLLTPQQLGRFRELKQQYDQGNQLRNRNNAANNPNGNPTRVLNPRQQMRMRRIQNRRQRAN